MSMIANDDMTLAQAAGLKRDDAMAALQGRALSKERYKEIAREVGQPLEKVQSRLELIGSVFNAQRRDINSAYWQTCVQSKKWATEKNLFCTNTFQPGCAPVSGATVCWTKLKR